MQNINQKIREVAMSSSPQFRTLTPADIPELAALAAVIWRVTYPDTLTQAQIEQAIALGYSHEALTQAMQGDKTIYGAFVSDVLTGFIAIEARSNNADLFIHKLYVHPGAQGSGLGGMLIEHVQNLHSPRVMRLNTNRKNVRAINFYFRQGFVIEKLDPHDSGVGFFADDFLFVRKFP